MKKKTFEHTLDLVLVLLLVILLAFTVAVLVIFYQTHSEPTALVYSVFGAITGEAGFCSIIMRQKLKNKSGVSKPPGDDSNVSYSKDELETGGGA